MEPVVSIVTLTALALVAALAPRFGADSRAAGPNNWPGSTLLDR